VLATINAIAERLTDERGLVYRYDTRGGADGLEGREGTFVLCTFWLALAGQPARARHVFEGAITYLNDVGLPAEEVDPATGELLGNFPQAFSHIGLINAAWAISEAERRQAASQPRRLTGPVPAFPPARRGSGHDPAAPKPGLPGVTRVTWYRSAATFGRRREGYLTLVPLTGLTGGLAMGSVAAASGLRVVDGIAGCDEAGDDPRDVALGDARRRGGPGVLPPPWVRATLAVLSEPGSVQTMRSLAASSPALKVARAMRDPGTGHPSGAGGERHAGQTPDAGRRALCIYCRTDRFVYWPSAIRLSLAECPGCQRRGPAGRDIAPLNGRPAAESSRTTPTARAECYLAAPASTTRFSTGRHATSLTPLFTARTGPMQVIGAPVAPDPAARSSLAL
jgi:hypothetical protein